MDDASRDGTAEAVAGAASPGDRAAQRGRRPASPARPTRGWRGPGARSCCSSTATPRWTPGALERLAGVFAREPWLGIAGALLHYPDGSPQWSGGREPTLAWFFALASGLPALLARLPLYRRARPLDATAPRDRRLGDRGGHGVPAHGLGGGGAARRGVPLLRPGPRLLPARPPGRLAGRGAAGLPGAPPPRRDDRPRPRSPRPPAPGAAVERPAALGPQAPRRGLGERGPAPPSGPAPACGSPPAGSPARSSPRPGAPPGGRTTGRCGRRSALAILPHRV